MRKRKEVAPSLASPYQEPDNPRHERAAIAFYAFVRSIDYGTAAQIWNQNTKALRSYYLRGARAILIKADVP